MVILSVWVWWVRIRLGAPTCGIGGGLVIYIGSHTGDQVTHNWTVPSLGTPVVQMILPGRDRAQLCRRYWRDGGCEDGRGQTHPRA